MLKGNPCKIELIVSLKVPNALQEIETWLAKTSTPKRTPV
jgi:hypothetical protein